jgi:hypothetical protein
MAEPTDEVAWMRRQRYVAGLRVLGVGLLILVPATVWLLAYANWDSNAPVTRIKVVGGVTIAIGGLLALAGLVMLLRARSRQDDDPIPPATARPPR